MRHPDEEPTWNDDFAPPGLSLDDATCSYEELGRRYTWFDRYPEWRVLTQTHHWVNRDRQLVVLDDLSAETLHNLCHFIRSNAIVLHDQAAADEERATSSAVAWMWTILGVPATSDLHPLVWLDSTPLMRWLINRVYVSPPRAWTTGNSGDPIPDHDDGDPFDPGPLP